MRERWLHVRRLTVLLVALAAIGHAQLASACLGGSAFAQGGPCCPMTAGHSGDGQGCCASSGECATGMSACAQPAHVAQISALSVRSGQLLQPPLPVWPVPPVPARVIAPPRGPRPLSHGSAVTPTSPHSG